MRTPDYWRDVPGTGGKYQVSRDGEIRHVWPSGKTTLLRPYLLNRQCHAMHRNRQFVHMRVGAKNRVEAVFTIVTSTWLGPPPPGMVWHHTNGNLWDNRLCNISPITRVELGRKTGCRATRRSVEKIDREGNVVELYTSAKEAGRANYMSGQAVVARCHGQIKDPFALMGYSFRYEDNPEWSKIKDGKQGKKGKNGR